MGETIKISGNIHFTLCKTDGVSMIQITDQSRSYIDLTCDEMDKLVKEYLTAVGYLPKTT